MNNNEHFDNYVRQELQEYQPQVHPRIWENIMQQRDKKKPVVFWRQFFNKRNLLLLVALLLVSGSVLMYVNSNNGTTKSLVSEVSVNTTNSLNTATNQVDVVKRNTNDSSSSTLVTENTTKAPNNLLVPLITNQQNKNIVSNTDLKTSKKATVVVSNNNFNRTHLSKNLRIKLKKDKIVTTNIIGEEIFESGNTFTLSSIFYTTEKNKIGVTTIPTNLYKRSFNGVVDPGCPSIEQDAAGNKTYVELHGGPDYAFTTLSDTANSTYLQKRKESTKFTSAFSIGFRYTKVFKNGVSVRTGINYSQINEKFIFNEGNIVQVVYIISAAGDTIGSYTNTGSRFKTTRNKFRTIDVPIVLGYEMGNGKLHANINAGVIINAYSWQRGEVLNANLKPENITTGKSNSQYQFKTNIGIGFIASTSLYYKLNEKWHLLAEPYFRYNLAPASKENLTLKQKYNTAGLRLGVRLDLR
jgi:hypothetical protein